MSVIPHQEMRVASPRRNGQDCSTEEIENPWGLAIFAYSPKPGTGLGSALCAPASRAFAERPTSRCRCLGMLFAPGSKEIMADRCRLGESSQNVWQPGGLGIAARTECNLGLTVTLATW
jgi:hypothetical protein